MKDVTIEDVKKWLEHHRRIGLTGVKQPGQYPGKPALLWLKYGDGQETWELMPDYVAELLLPYEGVAKAILYHRLPSHAPDDIVRQWLEVRMHILAGGEGEDESISIT